MNGYNPPPPGERKKFMFYDTVERQVQFKVRLIHDGLNQSQFFRLVMTGYLDGDDNIIDFVNECKERLKIHNVKKRRDSVKESERRKEIVKEFSLDNSDIESIFDMMEGDV